MDNSVCAVVVTYNPGPETAGNLRTYARSVVRLYVVDNSDAVPLSFELPSNAVLLHRGRNIGIAKALNLALETASDEGYAWLLTMDQDSAFDAESIARLLACRETLDPDALLLSPAHRAADRAEESCAIEAAETVMTSGNLVRIAAARAVGGYDERLFIDEVDHEFCLRGRRHGKGVWLLRSSLLQHRLGEMRRCGERTVRLYPPQRLYYMLRNYLLVRRLHRDAFPAFFDQRDRFLRGFFLTHLRCPARPLASARMLLRGWMDFKRGRFGGYDG